MKCVLIAVLPVCMAREPKVPFKCMMTTTVQATHLGACVVALGRVPAPELPVGQPLEPALEGAAVQVHEGLNQAEGTVGCCD